MIAYMQVLNRLLVRGNIINSFLDYCWWPCIDVKRIFHGGLVYKNGGSNKIRQELWAFNDYTPFSPKDMIHVTLVNLTIASARYNTSRSPCFIGARSHDPGYLQR